MQEGSAYRDSGLYFYTEIYAKAHTASRWSLMQGSYTSLVKTWRLEPDNIGFYGPSWANNPTTIATTTFSGSRGGQYDVLIRYWFRPPSSSSWSGPYGFQLGTPDWSNGNFTNYDSWGSGWNSSTCLM